MGADDGHGPRANPNDTPIPCVDAPVPNKTILSKPRHDMFKTGQVETPSSYAIAGKVLFAAAGAFTAILLALIALRMYNRGRRRHMRDRRRLLRSRAISGRGADEERDGGVAPSPRGLDPAVLLALPVLTAGFEAGDCAVCLAEFDPGEKARALPRCGHRFHVECIDAWFRGNSTCPLCRADVEAPDDTEAQTEVRIDVTGDAAAKGGGAPAMRRLPSGTDLDKTRRVFASARSSSF